MSFDPATLRRQFPLLRDGGVHYLDNAATAQLPEAVLDAVIRHETGHRANVWRGAYGLAESATAAYEAARDSAARFLNAPGGSGEVVFTSGTTGAINLLAHALGAGLAPGDEIVVSQAEHHSNLVPWLMLRERRGAVLKFIPVRPDGRLALDVLHKVVTPRCRLIALTHASNVTGAVTDVGTVVAAARAVGAHVLLDGAQAAQHGPVDVQALDVDFYAVSGHKCFGPTGIGVLWGRRDLLESLPPVQGGGGMVQRVTEQGALYADPPARFEAGTPPIAQAVGLGAAFQWMGALPWPRIREHEQALTRRLMDGLSTFKGVRIIGPVDLTARLPIVSFTLPDLHPHDLCQLAGEQGVALRGGHHCAQVLLQALDVQAVTRASFAPYNDAADVDALLGALNRALTVLG